jgi:tetratricopeptide (TPR) repeat protein
LARKIALTWTRAEIPQILHVQALERDVPRFGRLPLAGPEVLQPLALLGMAYAAAGAAGRGPWRRRPGIFVVALALAAFSVATALFFVTDRFRIQAVPLLAVMASLGSVAFATNLVESRRLRRAAPMGLALALLLLAWFGTWPRWLGLGSSLGEPWLEPMNRALTLAAAGGDSAAIATAFEEAIARGPDVARIYANRGEWRRLAGDLAHARADLTRAVEMEPQDPAAWTALAATQVALGDPQAFASYDRARALDPDYLPAALGRGLLLLRAQHPQDALPDLEAALAGPDSAAAHDALGVAIALLGDRRTGLRHIARAVELDPSRPLYLLHLGLAEAEDGAGAAAEAAFQAALARDPRYRPARLALATLYRDQGDRARARAQVESLLATSPADSVARRLASELGSAR